MNNNHANLSDEDYIRNFRGQRNAYDRLKEEAEFSERLIRTRFREALKDEYIDQIEEELDQLENEKKIDNLTGLYNREGAYEHIKKQIDIAHDKGQKFSVLFMDLDDFKQINDSLGHNEGDKYLAGMAEKLDSITRDTDNIISRYGGDEFMAVFSDVSREAAESIADRFRDRAEEYIEDHFSDDRSEGEQPEGDQGISIGLSIYDPDEHIDPDDENTRDERETVYRLQFKELVEKSDNNMYERKKT